MISLRKVALIWTTILIAMVATAAVLATRHVATVEVNKLLDNELQQIAINAGRGLSEAAHRGRSAPRRGRQLTGPAPAYGGRSGSTAKPRGLSPRRQMSHMVR